MNIILAEKPSLGRAIEAALKSKGEKNFKVLSLRGHLVEREIKNSKWKLEGLPLSKEETIGTGLFHTKKGDSDISKRVSDIKKAVFDKSTTCVYSAGDPDPEGSSLVIQVLESINFLKIENNGDITSNKPIKRMIFKDTTTATFFKSYKEALDIEEDYGMLYASKARDLADSIVGFNLTRLYGLLYGSFGEKISVGRVQTPTLGMVREREIEIEDFKPKKIYKIKVNTKRYNVEMEGDLNETTYKTKSPKKGDLLELTKVENKIEKVSPLPPCDNNDVLVSASSMYKYKPEKTTEILQELYESQYITYPRTETRHIPNTDFDNITKNILPLFVKDISKLNVKKTNKNVFDTPENCGAHYGIVPLKPYPTTGKKEILEVFEIISSRFVMSFMNDLEIEKEVFYAKSNNSKYKGTRQRIKNAGFSEYKNGAFTKKVKDNWGLDCELKKGDKDEIIKVESTVTTTKPPVLLKTAELLKKMKSIKIKGVGDNNSTSSIGTPATRSGIVTQLIKTGKIKDTKKGLTTTETGKKIYSKSIEKVNLQITAHFETVRKDIEKDPTNAYNKMELFISEIKKWVSNIIKEEKIKNPDYKEPGKGVFKLGEEGVIESFKYGKPQKTAYKMVKDKVEHVIWGEFIGNKINKSEAKELLEGQKIKKDGFISKKTNKEYSAFLEYNLKEKRIKMTFK